MKRGLPETISATTTNQSIYTDIIRNQSHYCFKFYKFPCCSVYIDRYHQYKRSTEVWFFLNIKDVNEKNKTNLISGPILRVIHQSIEKRRHFGNVNFYEVLYEPCKNYDTLVYESDNWSTLLFWFALSSGVFCFCVWPSFIGAVLSVMKVYWVLGNM